MKIKSLRIKNFRCFAEPTPWEFDPSFNVLIGNNATGKSTILDAISIGIGSYFLGIDQVYAKTILYKDIRKNIFSKNREYQLPCEIELTGLIVGSQELLSWQRSVLSVKGNTRRDKDTNKLAKIALNHQKLVRDGKDVLLPVFNYYGTGRLWRDKPSHVKTIPKSSRFTGYINSLEPISNSNTFMEWMKTRTYSELQKQKKDEALLLVQATVEVFLQGYQKIYFDVEEDSIMMEDIMGVKRSWLRWSELSDGYRNIIAIAADLAYRCYTLNPHLGIEAANKAEGVILIDEIDLHLHPSWQKTVVSSFKKAFPNLQFITTTHSPFIIQSLKNNELIDLQGQNVTEDYLLMGIEDIAEAEMSVQQAHRSTRFVEMKEAADEYFQLIQESEQTSDKDRIEQIKSRLEQLMIPFYDNPAYVSYLQMFKYPLIKNETGRKR